MNNFTDDEYLEISNQLTATGDVEKAELYLDKCLELNPDHTQALLNKGICCAEKHQFTEALSFFNKSLKVNNEDPYIFYHRSGVFIKLKDWSAAIDDLQSAVKLFDGYHPVSFSLLAYCLLSVKYYEQCIEICNLIKENDYDNFNAYSYKYHCLTKLGHYQELVLLAEKQIHASPQHADYYNNLGYAYLLDNQLQNAIIACDDALNFNPEHAYAQNNKGQALFEMGHYEKAYLLFCQSITNDISNPLAYLNRARYYLKAGVKEKAKHDLLKASELNYTELFDSEVDTLLLSEFKIGVGQ